MNTRKIDFTDVALYAITPSTKDTASLLVKIDGLLAGGVDAVQLRTRELTDREFISLAKEIRTRCHEAGALFVVNNRADLAFAVDADGLHLGHEDMPVPVAREIFGHRKIIGVSTHSIPQALEAQKAGADYVSCGPLWATPTKPEYPAVGLNLIGLYRAAVRVPFVAIGGIEENNIDQVVGAGASCVGVVRALFDAPDNAQIARRFREKVLAGRQTVVAQ